MKFLYPFLLCFALVSLTNFKAIGEEDKKYKQHMKWLDQKEYRQNMTNNSKKLIIETGIAKNAKCIQGRRLNELYAISFWSFMVHDSRLQENWEAIKFLLDKMDKKERDAIMDDKDELILLQNTYEAGLLLAMREVCPDVW